MVYLKKVPDPPDYDEDFCELCDLDNIGRLCYKVYPICDKEKITFKIVSKPIKSIKDLPKPRGE